MYRIDARWLNSCSTDTKQREVELYDNITFVLVGNDTTSHLLLRMASFASALIEYKYSRTVGHQRTYCTLSPDIQVSGN